MNTPAPNLDFPEEALRWFGPADPVPLAYIRQAGATAVFCALHEIPYGETWPQQAIRERRELIEAAGLRWSVVESVPVHEGIKAGEGDLATLFHNYQETLRNLAAEGIRTVVYNFMPVLDWIRTDMNHQLPDGSRCLLFNPVHFAAFELYALKRKGAEADYSSEQTELARAWWTGLSDRAKSAFIANIIDVFPGVKRELTLDDIRAMLSRYDGIAQAELERNLCRFLEAVIPTASKLGIRMAIHPDDPPFPVLGLPRIVSTQEQIARILKTVDDPASGICFCTGSLSARPDNDVVRMATRFAPRIHAVHLRSIQQLADGTFFEADHLGGSVDMPSVMQTLLAEQNQRREQNRDDWRLPLRPDHGHVMLDDLDKDKCITPGYTAIGRLRGLAELRGLMHGLRHGQKQYPDQA